jgi:hypothetical protein
VFGDPKQPILSKADGTPETASADELLTARPCGSNAS